MTTSEQRQEARALAWALLNNQVRKADLRPSAYRLAELSMKLFSEREATAARLRRLAELALRLKAEMATGRGWDHTWAELADAAEAAAKVGP